MVAKVGTADADIFYSPPAATLRHLLKTSRTFFKQSGKFGIMLYKMMAFLIWWSQYRSRRWEAFQASFRTRGERYQHADFWRLEQTRFCAIWWRRRICGCCSIRWSRCWRCCTCGWRGEAKGRREGRIRWWHGAFDYSNFAKLELMLILDQGFGLFDVRLSASNHKVRLTYFIFSKRSISRIASELIRKSGACNLAGSCRISKHHCLTLTSPSCF